MIWQHWLARVEYRFADYGTLSSTLLQGPTTNIDAFTSDVKLKTHSVLVGLAYKF
jgi:outer membrane immunogenic protein